MDGFDYTDLDIKVNEDVQNNEISVGEITKTFRGRKLIPEVKGNYGLDGSLNVMNKNYLLKIFKNGNIIIDEEGGNYFFRTLDESILDNSSKQVAFKHYMENINEYLLDHIMKCDDPNAFFYVDGFKGMEQLDGFGFPYITNQPNKSKSLVYNINIMPADQKRCDINLSQVTRKTYSKKLSEYIMNYVVGKATIVLNNSSHLVKYLISDMAIDEPEVKKVTFSEYNFRLRLTDMLINYNPVRYDTNKSYVSDVWVSFDDHTTAKEYAHACVISTLHYNEKGRPFMGIGYMLPYNFGIFLEPKLAAMLILKLCMKIYGPISQADIDIIFKVCKKRGKLVGFPIVGFMNLRNMYYSDFYNSNVLRIFRSRN